MTQQEAAHLQSQKAKELAQWATEQFQKELLEALQKTNLKYDPIKYLDLWGYIMQAVRHESPMSLNCSLETYSNIYKKSPDTLNMQEFEIAIAMVKSKKPGQLLLFKKMDDYLYLQRSLDELMEEWVKQTQTIAKPIEECIETSRKEQLDAYIAELRKKSVMDELQGNGAKRIPLGTA